MFIDGYEIDAAISEVHSLRAEVSSHPLESGADVVEHRRKMPRSITVEGVVSDTPIGPLAKRRQEFAVINGKSSALPSDEAYARLKDLHDTGRAVTIESSLDTFDDMVLTDLNVPRDRNTGEAFRFSATFVEIRFVATDRAPVDLPRAKDRQNRGHKPGETVESPPGPQQRLAEQLHARGEVHDYKYCGLPGHPKGALAR